MRYCVLITALALAAGAGVAYAGDSPLLVVGGWGVGEIDGHLLFYFGSGGSYHTSIPAPPQGPRWDVVYHLTPVIVLGAMAAILFWWRRRRRLSTAPCAPDG